MADILKISNSKISTWRKCHMAYHYKYHDHLRPKRKGIALRRGSIIHECIEAYDSGRSWRKPYKAFAEQFYRETFREEIVEFGDLQGGDCGVRRHPPYGGGADGKLSSPLRG